MDQHFASVISGYVSSRYNVTPPKIIISKTMPLGLYIDHNLNTIRLDPEANSYVLLHELGHHVFSKKNVNYPSEVEEQEANRFADYESKALGMKIDVMKPYTLKIKTNEPARLLNTITQNQSTIGITMRGYQIKNNELNLLFSIMPPGSKAYRQDIEVYSFPLLWAIFGLASLAGIWLVLGEIKQLPTPDITNWIFMICSTVVVGLGLYLAIKLVESK